MNGEWLAERFEADRTRLQAVAYRLLGSAGEADDAVQEAWLRLSRSDTSEVQNLSGWLTPVVARGAAGAGRRILSGRCRSGARGDAGGVGWAGHAGGAPAPGAGRACGIRAARR